MSEFADLITRVVSAYNATVYALNSNEEWHGHHDEFEAAIADLRRAERVRTAAALHRIPSPDPNHVVPINAPALDPAAPVDVEAGERDHIGRTPAFEMIDGKRWVPLTDYRLVRNSHGFPADLERLWMCVDDRACSTTWRHVP